MKTRKKEEERDKEEKAKGPYKWVYLLSPLSSVFYEKKKKKAGRFHSNGSCEAFTLCSLFLSLKPLHFLSLHYPLISVLSDCISLESDD